MQGPGDVIQWQVDFLSPGTYKVLIKYAAIPEWDGGSYIIEAGKSKIKAHVKSSTGWYEYKTENPGVLNIRKKGVTSIRLYPEKDLGHYLMYFNSMELVPE